MSGKIVNLAAARAARDRRPPSTNRLDTLSFVRKRASKEGGGFDYWSVATTGSYGTDCDKGRDLGAEYLAFLAANPSSGNASLLQCVVASMIERALAHGRDAKGIEVGFLQSVNEHALLAALAIGREAVQ
jgi:hypothetical protein